MYLLYMSKGSYNYTLIIVILLADLFVYIINHGYMNITHMN